MLSPTLSTTEAVPCYNCNSLRDIAARRLKFLYRISMLSELQDLSQWCCRMFVSSGMWRRVDRWVPSDVSNDLADGGITILRNLFAQSERRSSEDFELSRLELLQCRVMCCFAGARPKVINLQLENLSSMMNCASFKCFVPIMHPLCARTEKRRLRACCVSFAFWTQQVCKVAWRSEETSRQEREFFSAK